VYAPQLDRYRKYPNVIDEEGKRKGAELLFDQYHLMGKRVPLGQGRKYIYLNREGWILLATPWAELVKLDEFISRQIWWEKIRSGNKQVVGLLSKDSFATLYRSIDGESPEYIPMLSFATNLPMIRAEETDRVVDALITGLLKNKVLSSRYAILRALKDIYVDRYEKLKTSTGTKKKINIALWEFKREANRLDLHAGHELVREGLTLGKRSLKDDGPFVPIKPVGVGKRDEFEVVELGFRLPNDEILASSYRLVVADEEKGNAGDASATPAEEAKERLIDMFNARFYASSSQTVH
jgi:hypothetical protein